VSYDNFNALMAELAEREMIKEAVPMSMYEFAPPRLSQQRDPRPSPKAAKPGAKMGLRRYLMSLFNRVGPNIQDPTPPGGYMNLGIKEHLSKHKGKYALGAGAVGLGGLGYAAMRNRRRD
jgi:hypothetical protein